MELISQLSGMFQAFNSSWYNLVYVVGGMGWLCWIAGIMAFQYQNRDKHCRVLAKALFFLCPVLFTIAINHSVKTYERTFAARKSQEVSDVLVRNAEVVTPSGAVFAFYRPANQSMLRTGECCRRGCKCSGPCSCSASGPCVCPDRLPESKQITSTTAGRL